METTNSDDIEIDDIKARIAELEARIAELEQRERDHMIPFKIRMGRRQDVSERSEEGGENA